MRTVKVKPIHEMTQHERYFGAATVGASVDSLETWRSYFKRVVDLMDKLSPRWRERSLFVGDALHQELADVVPAAYRAKKDKVITDARSRVMTLEEDLQRAKDELARAEAL